MDAFCIPHSLFAIKERASMRHLHFALLPFPQRHWSPSRNRGQVEGVSEGVYRGLLEGVSGCGGWSIPAVNGRWRAQAGGESVVHRDVQWSIQTSVVHLSRSSIGPVAEFATSLLDDEWEQ
jgi:hypothetical protein